MITQDIKQPAKLTMKVLVIHTRYKQRGGEDAVVENEVALLRSAGYNVEVLEFSNAGSTGFKVALLSFNFASYKICKKKIKDFKPNVVHIHNTHFAASPSIFYAVKHAEVASVMTLHNYRLLCPSATLYFKGKLFTDSLNKPFPWKAVFKGVYLNSKILTFWISLSMWYHQIVGTWKIVNTYIILGNYTKEIFKGSKLNYLCSKFVVKPNFCFPAEMANKLPGAYYLYVGRLSEEKGIKTLLEAFSANKRPLIIAGTGPLNNLVEQYCSKNSNITYLGLLNKNDVAELISKTKALIFTSEWFETFGMVIIEAFAAGVPVIAANMGQLSYMINNQVNGLHFEAGNPIDLTRAIAEFEKLSVLKIQQLKANALETYEYLYTPKKNIDQLMQIYQIAINDQRIKANM